MKNLKRVGLTMIITGILFLLGTNNVQAALQSNPSTQSTTTKKAEAWMKQFRYMEQVNQGMGLSEKLNADLTFSGESNNIDVHMMKSTEYGAIAILSASGYGNPRNDKVISSTTGNKTGVIMKEPRNIYDEQREYVAAGLKDRVFTGIDGRYYDAYERNVEKIGDALGTATSKYPGCKGWHSAESSDLSFPDGTAPKYFIRGGYYGYFHFTQGGNYGSTPLDYFSRGVAVCGEGL